MLDSNSEMAVFPKQTKMQSLRRCDKWVLGGLLSATLLVTGIIAMVAIAVLTQKGNSEGAPLEKLFSEESSSRTPAPTVAGPPTEPPVLELFRGVRTPNPQTSDTVTTTPTVFPTGEPSPSPTASPTGAPFGAPTGAPTESASPTFRGETQFPTSSPTTARPTDTPTSSPTEFPTSLPTTGPTAALTVAPVTLAPVTSAPSLTPVFAPVSVSPTSAPAAAAVIPVPTVSTPATPRPTSDNAVTTFYALGDAPYSSIQANSLRQQMLEIPDDAEFVIHVGDLRQAREDLVCEKSQYDEAAAVLRNSPAPVFVIIGDNDWTDCPNKEEGLELWNNEFVGFEGKHWNHTFDIKRQPGRPDNFAFEHKGSLFLGLNIIGGDVHNASEWSERLTDEVEWTKDIIRAYRPVNHVGRIVIFGHAYPSRSQSEFFEPLLFFVEYELNNSIPIMYLNGDLHRWQYTPNYKEQSSFLHLMVTGLAVEPPTKIDVVADGQFLASEEAFVVDRRL